MALFPGSLSALLLKREISLTKLSRMKKSSSTETRFDTESIDRMRLLLRPCLCDQNNQTAADTALVCWVDSLLSWFSLRQSQPEHEHVLLKQTQQLVGVQWRKRSCQFELQICPLLFPSGPAALVASSLSSLHPLSPSSSSLFSSRAAVVLRSPQSTAKIFSWRKPTSLSLPTKP